MHTNSKYFFLDKYNQQDEKAATVSAIRFDNLSSMMRMGDEITDIESDDDDDDDKSSIYEPFTAFNPVRSKSVLANAAVGYSSDSSV